MEREELIKAVPLIHFKIWNLRGRSLTIFHHMEKKRRNGEIWIKEISQDFLI